MSMFRMKGVGPMRVVGGLCAAALGPAPKLATDGRSVEVALPPLGVTVFSLVK